MSLSRVSRTFIGARSAINQSLSFQHPIHQLSKRWFATRDAKSMEDIQNTVAEAGNKLVIVEWKATWCGKCKVLAKELERLASLNPSIEVLYADIDAIPEGKTEAGVEHLPAIHAIKDGEMVAVIEGVKISELGKLVEQHK